MILIILLTSRITLTPFYYTNTNYIYELAAGNDCIYAATNGGLISYCEPGSDFDVITSADGLINNCQKCLAIDSSLYIWVGSDAGLALVSDDLTDVAVYPPECLTCDIIQDIVCRRDSIYVGSAGGMLFINLNGTPSDFSDDRRIRIFEEMGGLISNNVLSIAVTDNHIWAGTDKGITRFTKNFDPDSTCNYTVANGLLNNRINKLAFIDTFIYVASDSGLNIFNGTDFDSLVLHQKVIDIIQVGDSLGLALDSAAQFGFYYNDSLIIRNSGLYWRSKPRSLLYTDDKNLYCGQGNRWVDNDMYGDGFGQYNFTTNSWTIIQNRCLPLNRIADIAATEHGIFTACSDRTSQHARGLGWLRDDQTWTIYNRDTILSSNMIHRCKQASDGRIWLGVNTFSSNGPDTCMLFSFDPVNDIWEGYPGGFLNMAPTVAVWDLEFDKANNMYIALAGPADKVYAIDSALTQAYFLTDRTVGFIVEIALDSIGRIWLSRLGDVKGLLRIDTKNTLFDRSDDLFRTFGSTEGLAYGNCYGSIVDQQGELFIANENALIKFDGGFTTVYSNPDDEFFDLELDHRGRIWAMARHGLYCYDPLFETIEQYEYEDLNVDVDFLPTSNEVIQLQGFEFDSLRNCFWIGNSNGLLKLTIDSDPVTVVDSILIYPNPAVNQEKIHIKNIPFDARVNIFTISGRMIAEGLAPDPVFNEIIWSLPDNISSGLYFAVVHSVYGRKVVKFAIVR